MKSTCLGESPPVFFFDTPDLVSSLLSSVVPAAPQPVITIGIARSDRLENLLPTLEIPFIVHLSSHYPSSFSNGADRNPRPTQQAGLQQDVPPMGSSCGLLADDRHSVTLGSYIRLSSAPKKTFILTAPLSIGPSVLVLKGNVVTQPSVSDRQGLNEYEDRLWRDVLKKDRQQAAAFAARRVDMKKTFELGRTTVSTSGVRQPPKDTSMVEGSTVFESVWDGTQKKKKRDQTPACASDSWAIVEITRPTTIAACCPVRKWWTFLASSHVHSEVHALVPGLMVSKTGRTTGRTFGTVNGVKSLYRLPRDGPGVRRWDYPIVSYPGGGPFGLPGDAGALVLAQQVEDMDETEVATNPGKPCGLIVACSTRGQVSYVQDMESIVTGVKSAGMGHLSFMEVPR